MQFAVALIVLAVAAGVAVVYWRTDPRHRLDACERVGYGSRARRDRESSGTPHHG
ncbi:hypothetical protein MO973_31975 [Paenibacillus sp. TRM 82003]|uniref:hypothetical protein n=1 Tax=Kineococcus sp. TRM81007 TaxID=2925831 RepID=UPI001F588CA4|nr:hypothetical protein [Kineococcus sp. TRM81007]MCI2239156.1 hypothetical protein [Kineococcus sp. TRM81007]MCI3924835.1 hypothetical protein [Paenibacillus sp. TRM 82003]